VLQPAPHHFWGSIVQGLLPVRPASPPGSPALAAPTAAALALLASLKVEFGAVLWALLRLWLARRRVQLF